ncbi:endodeoxyribonuclease, partial [Methylobacterium sp. Leaf466]|uniref:endodeoxyribonuclease n=1 Tax=Methylobacterium sp. Leaf466 TaxID=1736386 RepID=UPI000ACCDE47
DPSFNWEDHYEAIRLPYTVPERTSMYTPDLYWPDRKLAIEMKGRFRDSDERGKYIHFRDSNPDIGLKFVLQRPGIRIYKTSKTTQEEWLRKHGFEVAFKTIPQEWLD